MSRFALFITLVATTAVAGKPRGVREEKVSPLVIAQAPKEPVVVVMVDLGLGSWSSSLVNVLSLEGSFSMGRWLTRHLMITAELAGALSTSPASTAVLIRGAFTVNLAWDVLALVRANRSLPVEFGPELGIGGATTNSGPGWALPLIQGGGFLRYLFSPTTSLGLRIKGQFPFWTEPPRAFTAGRRVNEATALEPAGIVGTASFVYTF